MSLLKVRDLSVAARGRNLVDSVSFTLDAGERLGIIGESGSGKSLTATAIIGLLPPGLSATGSVLLDGHEVIGAREGELTALRGAVAATVFQDPLTALDPLMRVGRQIGEVWERTERRAGRPHGKGDTRAAVFSLMDEVSLPEPERIAGAFPHEISGGQRQRVAIAMALACRPKLLIADEPTTALDVTTQKETLALLARLVADHGMTLLFISHDLPVVAGIVDRVVVMRTGVVVEEGPVRQVFATPTHAYTRELLVAAERFDRALGAA
ncbi:peptide/nickel transport system ATP-binding protein [Kaistia soli DSM 19436]|uniref:Peptide/nickel transport system ATP-binding protein n=1 Tax=Kaistia soli DSM 19436 TaxID=1122133 RepID=A0A1M4WKL4_9HYPH|nr:ABC transporter ATP-binding protein [Kaistia soli]SHE81593.1 peptide/nickel transport system ATP-binding protein [Kaistia soli DSM 19436]